MIGALLLKRNWGRKTDEAIRKRDVEAIGRSLADDAVYEYAGTHDMAGRFEGVDAIQAWMRRWFDHSQSIRYVTKRVAVTHPFSIGLTNTVVAEWEVDETSHEGVTVHADGITITDVRRGRITRQRTYLFDETPDLVMWGRKKASPSTSERGQDVVST